MGKMKSKDIKGFYSVWEKVEPGEIDGQKLTGKELAGLFDYIKSVPISDRYSGAEGQLLIAFNGDKLTGDADFIVPPETNDFLYGLFMKKRDVALPRQGTQTEDGLIVKKIDIGDQSFMFEVSYFMVDKVNGIVLLINNKNVGNLKNFSYYLQGFLASGEDSSKYKLMIGERYATMLNAAYIPENDIFSHLSRLKRITQLNYKLGGKEGQSLRVPGYESSDEALSAASRGYSITDMESLGGVSIEIKISPGRGGSLNSSVVKKIFNQLSDRLASTKRKKKFKVEGRDSNNQFDVLDFISDNIMMSTNVSYEGKYVANSVVFTAMENDFLKQRSSLLDRTKS